MSYIPDEPQVRVMEHDQDAPETRKVSMYAWDPSTLSKKRVVVGSDGSLVAGERALAIRLDTSTPGTTYIGKAEIGTTTSEALWQIAKVVVTASALSIQYAGGDGEFDNVWDDRAGLPYS